MELVYVRDNLRATPVEGGLIELVANRWPSDMKFSPDGSRLFCVADQTVYVCDIAKKSVLREISIASRDRGTRQSWIEVLPSGFELLATIPHGRPNARWWDLRIVNVVTGESTPIEDTLENKTGRPAPWKWVPRVDDLDVSKRGVIRQTDEPIFKMGNLSADERFLPVLGQNAIYLYDLRAEKFVASYRPSERPWSVAIGPTNRTLAIAVTGGVRIVELPEKK